MKKIIAGTFIVFSPFLLVVFIFGFFIAMSFMVTTSIADQGNDQGFFTTCNPISELDYNLFYSNFDSAGDFAGQADLFIKSAEQHGIDPVLMTAIAFAETGTGKHVPYNNPGGLMNPDTNWSTLIRFDTLEEGINAMARNLNNLIVGRGLTSISDLGSVYSPIGASNDPTGLNANWVPNVTGFVSQLGGLTMNCENVGDVELIGDVAWIVPFTKNITSGFGSRWGTMHKGIDIASMDIYGKPIVAFRDGTVIVSELNGTVSGGLVHGRGYGYQVIIDHGDGMKTRYAHMATKGIQVGTKVVAGQQVGIVGSTGNSSGPHLHFEILINENAVDPMSYLSMFFQ